MTKEQFLNAVGDIDDKYIKIMYDASNEPEQTDEIDTNDEKPQVIYLPNRHISFRKIAVSVAAAVIVLAAGVFAVSKLNGILPAGPNSGSLSKNTEQSGGKDGSSGISEQSSQSSSESSSDSSAPEDPASEYEYRTAHRFDNVIKQRGIYGETEIPDIHYENADLEGCVTHSPFGDEWQYYGLESMVFETHTLGDYTIRLIGYNVRTDKEYFPNTIFGSFGYEVEKDGEMITKGGYSVDLTTGAGAQFHVEEQIFTDKIGSYLDVYDMEYPVIAMRYYFGNNPDRLVHKCVQFGFLLNDEAIDGFVGVCEPGCGIAYDMENYTTIESINVVNSKITNCMASVFEAEKFKIIDKKTLFDEVAGITYTFKFDTPMTTFKDVPFEFYTAEKNVGSTAASKED